MRAVKKQRVHSRTLLCPIVSVASSMRRSLLAPSSGFSSRRGLDCDPFYVREHCETGVSTTDNDWSPLPGKTTAVYESFVFYIVRLHLPVQYSINTKHNLLEGIFLREQPRPGPLRWLPRHPLGESTLSFVHSAAACCGLPRTNKTNTAA